MQRWRIRLVGVVQGIGFRPFVYRVAREHGLTGFVLNDSAGAEIQVQGSKDVLEQFMSTFWAELPPLADVAQWQREEIPCSQETEFNIQASRSYDEAIAFVTADAHVCQDCLDEMADPADRRYRYPFTNCTNCGPRYTIITAVPYDRPNTTMVDFPMCDDCRAEYENPGDRRFHAQPIACPKCGPRLWLTDAAGREVACDDPIEAAARALSNGDIVAIKGLGGFHLAVDASNGSAVARLRSRKWREAKPFALMVRDIDVARRLVVLDDAAEDVLTCPARPIVLAPRRQDASVAHEVAPGLFELGIMLPYTPVHHLLLADAPPALVMTSGNPTSEPLCHENDAALARLDGIADWFLLHNRRIQNPCDDSVVRSRGSMMLRRGRGYAPKPLVPEGLAVDHCVLAVGPELKNTVCVTRPGQFVLSEHLGDLTNPAAVEAFEKAVDRLEDLMQVRPEWVACDQHPHYYSTAFAKRIVSSQDRLIAVQHHHAHMAACMLENGVGRDEQVLGVVWDGTGYGLDGTIWGGEFFVGGYHDFVRAAHLRPIPLPGGDAAIRHPWRIGLAALVEAGLERADMPSMVRRQDPGEVDLLTKMVRSRTRVALSSGAGRYFDACAALIDFSPGVSDHISYDGQAPIELEALAAQASVGPGTLPYAFDGSVLDFLPMLRALADRVGAVPASALAADCIDTLASACVSVAVRLAEEHGMGKIALSGGCFQNARLLARVEAGIQAAGLSCLVPRRFPPNDGGISAGQAAVALAKIESFLSAS
ncbi:MAG: carbamoyltransferase HypF [Deltaproteobacteria bacterium]|nr:carbamoyltransferase HypF [Deltaproteobacteria bacterium]